MGLFSAIPGVDKLHAKIKHEATIFCSARRAGRAGTWVNDQPVNGTQLLLRSDLISVCRSLVRFGKRKKREE